MQQGIVCKDELYDALNFSSQDSDRLRLVRSCLCTGAEEAIDVGPGARGVLYTLKPADTLNC